MLNQVTIGVLSDYRLVIRCIISLALAEIKVMSICSGTLRVRSFILSSISTPTYTILSQLGKGIQAINAAAKTVLSSSARKFRRGWDSVESI
jgi:hypothetical protein